MATWLTRRNKIQGCGPMDPAAMFRGLVSASLRAEWEYYRLVCNLDAFQRIWGIDGAVCRLCEGKLFICV